MRKLTALFALAALVLALGASAATEARVTSAQVVKRFKAATGDTLRRDRAASDPGVYEALDFGSRPSFSLTARYGQITIFVVVADDVDAAVLELLEDSHTGGLAKPDAKGIYWEEGLTLHGERTWLAKKRYGQNLVLWSLGERKRTDRRFARVDRVLAVDVTRAAVGP
jgi:hypothetical protein